ncbi:MAG: T9SS type A sorting domain-containing protein, partial [Bacteroidia bacterium]|nr:T9SS type A sorting domain-containing protein [Bacteroidia bacterium]
PNQTTQTISVTLINQKYFRCILTCSPFSDTSNCLSITYKSFYNCYCASYPSIAGLSDIGNIKLAGYSYGGDTLANPIVNNTYTDYTTTLSPIVLEQGAHYPMQITAALSNFSPGYNTLATVYIDFNHNAIFDANEFSVVKNFNNYFPSVGNGILQLPANAMLGLTRMRIILSTGPQNLNNSLPCSAYKYYGETEDYLVSIVPPTPCPMLNHGYIATNNTTICPTEKFVLTYFGNSNLIQSNYRWQSSSDSSNWTNISGTLYEVYSSLLSVAAYYRCIVTCGNSADTTHAIYLQKKPFETCYCTSTALDSGIVDIGFIQLGDFKNGNDTLPLNPSSNRKYSDFTTSLPPIQLYFNSKEFILIRPAFTVDTVINCKAIVSIDLNHDGFFSSYGYETIVVDNFQLRYPFTGFATVYTYNALPGITRMRIKLVAGSDIDINSPSCDNYLYGETQDYLVNIVSTTPACQPLLKGKVVAHQKYACTYNNREDIFYYSGTTFNPALSYKWQYSTDSSVWYTYANTNVPSISFQNMNPSFKYLRCILSCGVFKDTSIALKVIFGNKNNCFCKFQTASTIHQDIGNVTLLSLSNGNALPFLNNPKAINRYADFTNLAPVDLTLGFNYPISVSQINQGAFRDAKVVCYIDYNANGYFEDWEESVIGYSSDTSAVPGKVTGTISIPYYAITSVLLMRIALAEKTNNTKINPCSIYSQPATGEAEDYLVKIVPNTNCVQPVAGNAYAPINRYCLADSVYLQLKNYSLINGQSYQWQYSYDGNVWNNSGGKLNYPTRILQIYNPTYYRCIVSCNSLQDTSTSVFIGMLPQTACNYCGSSTSSYPLGGSECFWNDKIIHVKLQGTALDNADTNCYKINNSFSYTFPDVGNTTALIGRGKTYKLFVTTSKTTNVSAWIDFNNDKVFSASEWFNVSDTSQAYVPDSITFTVPLNATLGNTRMRIRSRYAQNQNDNNDACSYFFSGETEDYVLRIDLASNTEVLSQNFDVSIEPNPANEFINVTVHSVESDKYQIQLLNMQGQLVYFGDLKKEETVYRNSINVQKLAKGIYTLQLKSSNNTINRKVVIQ